MTTRAIQKKKKLRMVGAKLLSSRDVTKILGLDSQKRAWITLRKHLMSEYGMRKTPGAGTLIPAGNLARFLSEHYEAENPEGVILEYLSEKQ